jgi:hypothetical protein
VAVKARDAGPRRGHWSLAPVPDSLDWMGTRQGSFSRSRLVWTSLPLPVVALGLFGCLPPPRMELSAAARQGTQQGVWWHVAPTAALEAPVVGIEQPLSGSRVRQWLIDDRGIRLFDYRGGRAKTWSPPRSGQAPQGGFTVARSLIRARFGAEDEPGWPGPRLPADEVARLTGPADLVGLLRRHWGDRETDPPPGLTAHELEQAMEAARITLGDLLKSGM